ncbi:Uncharacterised protein [Trueperella bialowiezensis]|uniref:Uncharacterized protein n=1 Tax=Trueperella bialowiezensis TaxID=312285 RepID=A0A3S5EW57_9ACTO|nr:Uncharacterised protein [Trueperella bialowiezensis]
MKKAEKIAAKLEAKKLGQFSDLMHAWNHGGGLKPDPR